MRAFRRSVFSFAAGVSLLLSVTAAIAWPLSYWQAVSLRPVVDGRQPRMYVLNSGRIVAQDFFPGSVNPRISIVEWIDPQPTSLLQFARDANHLQGLGFEWCWSLSGRINFGGESATRMTIPSFMLAIPLWFPMILFAWPIIPLIRRRRRAVLPEIHCQDCGYDLRATPERCPECGSETERRVEPPTSTDENQIRNHRGLHG